MTALYFGDSESPLFGVWSQPSNGKDRDHGVVLCPPIAQEHVRTHWALRQVASALCRAGFHTFRFDWFGVGDSAGDLQDATIARWKEDLVGAAQELRDAAGVAAISLVGVRLGATVAALASEEVRPSSIVLWDPVVRGRDYLAGLGAMTRSLLTDPTRFWNVEPSRIAPRAHLVGFDFGEALFSEIERVELAPPAAISRVPVCLLRSSEDPSLTELGASLRDSRPDVTIRDTDLRSHWTNAEYIEEMLLPGDALRALTSFLEGQAL